MEHKIWLSDRIPLHDQKKFVEFLQMQANRVLVGQCRYGVPNFRQKYMSRMVEEVKAYKKKRSGGNMEQLCNIPVYCYLESVAPEHPNFHFNPSVDSVTRRKFGT